MMPHISDHDALVFRVCSDGRAIRDPATSPDDDSWSEHDPGANLSVLPDHRPYRLHLEELPLHFDIGGSDECGKRTFDRNSVIDDCVSQVRVRTYPHTVHDEGIVNAGEGSDLHAVADAGRREDGHVWPDVTALANDHWTLNI